MPTAIWKSRLRSGRPTAIWKSRLRSGSTHWDLEVAVNMRSGSVHCDLEVIVEVRKCPLGSGASGGGPAVPTGIWSSRWRSGCTHWDLDCEEEAEEAEVEAGEVEVEEEKNSNKISCQYTIPHESTSPNIGPKTIQNPIKPHKTNPFQSFPNIPPPAPFTSLLPKQQNRNYSWGI